MWYDLLKVRDLLKRQEHLYKEWGVHQILGRPLGIQGSIMLILPCSFELCENKEVIVAQVVNGTPITF
jgi:hypothetical protein